MTHADFYSTQTSKGTIITFDNDNTQSITKNKKNEH